MEIQEATFREKKQIIRQHPHTRQFLKRQGILYIAAEQALILGFAFVQRRKLFHETALFEDLILVIEVFEPERRRKGIASALVDQVRQRAAADGSYQVIAYYAPNNLASHALWIKNRFCVTPPDKRQDENLSGCCAVWKC